MPALLGSPNMVLRDLAGIFMEGAKEVRPSLMPRLCQIVPSDRQENKYAYPLAVPQPRVWTDERVVKNIDVITTFTIKNDTFEVTLEFSGDLLDDSAVFGLDTAMREAGMSMALHPDKLVSDLVRLAGTAGSVAYDGQVFYSAAHKWGGDTNSDSIDNDLAGTGVTTAAFKTDFNSALAALMGVKDNEGRLYNPQMIENAANLIAHVPLALQQPAMEAMNAVIISNTSNVPIARAIVVPDGYQTDTNDWYLHYVGMPEKPFIWQEREALSVKTLGKDSELYARDGRVGIYARMRGKAGYHRFERSVRTVN